LLSWIATIMQRDSGFTLVEVLVAAMLLTVGMGAIAYLVIAATRVNGVARRSTYAALLAADKLEELRALPFDDPALAVSPPGALTVDADGFHDVPVEGYRRRWTIAPLASHPANALALHVLAWSPGDPGEASLIAIKARKAE
jgi:prepilin-type N-terminal cleavage/methylation domain-containing protein